MNNGEMKRERKAAAIARSADYRVENAYLDAYLAEVKRHGFTSAILTEELEAEIREIFPGLYKAYDFSLEERHVANVPTKHFVAHYEKSGVRQHQARLFYNSYQWVFADDPAGWPSAWWFRFGQEKWEDSTWRLLPALPASMLAAMGYPLVTSCRYMGDLSDEQKAELLQLLTNHDSRGGSSAEDVVRTKELLALTSYGMELPVLDVDTVKPPKDTPASDLPAWREKIGRAAADLAVKVSAAWQEIMGIGVHWTVTNDRGGLHGRSLPLPADLRHPDLLMMLTDELMEQCKRRGVPYKLVGGRGEWKETDLAVIDLSTFQKSGAGRGGMWRTPGSKKDAHMGPGSLPQTPVSKLLEQMPWLSAVTPEALGADWGQVEAETKTRIIDLCVSYRAKKDEKELKAGRAVRGEDGKIRRIRSAPVEANPELGSTEFAELALTVRELMPMGASDGMRRHDVRLALAGWLYRCQLSEAAASATLAACGGNVDDSLKVVRTTYARVRAGEGVAGLKKLVELLGKDNARKLEVAFDADYASRVDTPRDPGPGPDPADSEPGDEDAGSDFGYDGPPPSGGAPPPEREEANDHEGRGSSSTPKKKAKPAGREANPAPAKARFHPHTLVGLYTLDAKKANEKKWEGPADGELVATRQALAEIQKKLEDTNKFWFVQKTVADSFVFAGLGLDLVTRTALRGEVRFSHLRSIYVDAEKKFSQWGEGEEIPKFSSLSSIKNMVEYWPYVRLSSAIADDLHRLKAPFEVVHRATIDHIWSKAERTRMKYLLDGATQGRPEKVKGPLAFIEDARRCGWMLNKRSCPIHGLISRIPVVCEREVSCKYCRSKLYEWLGEWITRYWLQDKYVVFDVPATSEEVIKEFREKFEVDRHGKKVEKGPRPTPDYEFWKEDEASKYTILPKAFPQEKRFTLAWNPEKKDFKLKIKRRRRSQHKVVERKRVSNLLDRIKLGFTQSKEFKTFKQVLGKSVGVRAWPTPTGIRVVMPATFDPVSSEEEMPEEQDTLTHLMMLDLWQDRSPKVVGKEECLTLILDARRQIGDRFDELIHALGKDLPDIRTPNLKDAEEELKAYPFLRNGAMRPVKNKRAEVDLPWFTKTQMREFMKIVRAERLGKTVEELSNKDCPVPVPDEVNGGEKPCCRVLHTELETETGTLAQNNQGKFYAGKEANEIADGQGVTFTGVAPVVGKFAPPSERMAC